MKMENPMIEVNQKKWPKWVLRVLLVISFLLEALITYSIINKATSPFHLGGGSVVIFKSQYSLISLTILFIISTVLNFTPYLISRYLYKKGKYIQQVIWGVVTLVLFFVAQIILFRYFYFVFCLNNYKCSSQAYIEAERAFYDKIPCIPQFDPRGVPLNNCR